MASKSFQPTTVVAAAWASGTPGEAGIPCVANPDPASLPRFVIHPLAMVGSDSVFIGDLLMLKASINCTGRTSMEIGVRVEAENLKTGESGLGNTEIFALMIPKSWDWGSGRFGIGPLVTLPGDEQVARDEWGYGLAGAVVNSSGKWFYGVLLTQSWRAIDPQTLPPGTSDTNPLGIAPILNYQLGGGWYVGNGDMVARWDWDTGSFYLPIGIRVGKVFVGDDSSWNAYFEYQTSLVYGDWLGSAVKNSYRFNVTYTWPLGK